MAAADVSRQTVSVAEAATYARCPPVFANLDSVAAADRLVLQARWQAKTQDAPPILLHSLGEATITAPGAVWLPGGRLVAESLHNMTAERQASLIAAGPPRPVPVTQGQALLLARAGSMNYGHWLVEHLGALLLLRAAMPDLRPRLLVNDPRGPAIAMRQVYADSVRLAGLDPAALLPRGREPVRVADLLMLSPASVHSHMKHPAALAALAGLAPKRPATEMLFIRRTSTAKRVLRNLDAVEAAALRLGFRSITPGRMSLAEQIEAFAAARVVVGVSGADLTNIAFMPEGGAVVCLLPARGREFFFWDIGCLRRHRSWSVFGPPLSERGGGHDDFTVDVALAARIMAQAAGTG